MAIDEREFLDLIYRAWTGTTEAEGSYWMYEEMVNLPEKHKIYAVKVNPETMEETRTVVASFLSEADAAFITALHGSLPDIVRRCHEAYDEADQKDYDRDERECRIAELELEIQNMTKELDKIMERR